MNVNNKTCHPGFKTAVAAVLAAGFTQSSFAAPGDPIGNPITIGTSSYDDNVGPRVASDANGNMVAAWLDYPSNAIVAQRLDASGNPSGSVIQLAALAASDYELEAPTVAVNAAGQFVVAWTEYQQPYSSATRPAAKTNLAIQWPVAPTLIHARTFNADGTPVSGDIMIADMPFNPIGQDAAAVAMDDDGDFVVGWWKGTESPVVEGYEPEIYSETQYVYARVYSMAGKPKTLPIKLDGGRATKSWFSKPLTGYWAGPIAVGMDGPGNFTVAWYGQQLTGPLTPSRNVMVQSFSTAGKAIAPAAQIYNNASFDLLYVGMAMNRAGQYTLAWSCQDASAGPVCAQSFQPGNVAASGVINVYGNPPSLNNVYTSTPTVAIDAGGDFIVGAFTDICSDPLPCTMTPAVRLFAFNGTPLSANVLLPNQTPNTEVSPGVGIDANGDAETLYSGPNNGPGFSSSLLLQRISGH